MKLALVRTAAMTIPRARGQFEPRDHLRALRYLAGLLLSAPEARLVDLPLALGTTLVDESKHLALGHFDQIGQLFQPKSRVATRELVRVLGSPRRFARDSSVRFILNL